MRKFFILISLAISAVALTGCWNNTITQSTPQMIFGNLYVNPQVQGDTLILGAKDTLDSRYDEDFAMEYLDTMSLGDTLMFPALFDSYMNNLVNVTATFDTLSVDLWFGVNMKDPKMKQALAASSDPQRGILDFNPMYSQVAFPIYIVPLKAGSHPIKLVVTSDSEFPMNACVFTIPVK